jgi:hypothetical protein
MNMQALENIILRIRLLEFAERKYGKITLTGSQKVLRDPSQSFQMTASHGMILWFNAADGSTHIVTERSCFGAGNAI